MKYTLTQLRTYLSAKYVSVHRKMNADHFYNYRNRLTMSIPVSTDKGFLSESEVRVIFEGKSELPVEKEIARLNEFINQPK